jgi:uncharacterized protein YjiS (DUF1127 family)
MLTTIKTLGQKMSRRAKARHDFARLAGMSDRMLRDIGVSRADLRHRVFNGD